MMGYLENFLLQSCRESRMRAVRSTLVDSNLTVRNRSDGRVSTVRSNDPAKELTG